ncbi:amidohydrolase family protein [Streptomyces cellulosae]
MLASLPGVDGITLLTSYSGRHLGDPYYEPLMAELDRFSVVVLLHPASPPCWEATTVVRPRPTLGFLVLKGVLQRYPAIRFVDPHAGAALPALVGPIAALAFVGEDRPVEAQPHLQSAAAAAAAPSCICLRGNGAYTTTHVT